MRPKSASGRPQILPDRAEVELGRLTQGNPAGNLHHALFDSPHVPMPSGGAPGFVQTPAPIGAPSAAARPCDCDDKLAAIAARLEAMQHHGNATPSASTPASFSSAARTAAALAVGALGISGPTGLGVIAAGTLGGWLIGRTLP